MSGLDQALSGLASGQLQAIVAAAQSKLQAVPATGSTSASAAVDVAVHDTKILFPPVNRGSWQDKYPRPIIWAHILV